MLKVQRLAIVWSATIFFLIISPILAIYALGYDFDINKNNLNSTVTLSVETAPDNAKIEAVGDFGNIVNSSNVDFRIATNAQFKINLSKDGFLPEDFYIKGKGVDNTLVRLKKVHLLPSESKKLSFTDSNWVNQSFVSKDYIIYSKTENNFKKWFLQQYSYSGFLAESKPLTPFISDQKIENTTQEQSILNLSSTPDVKDIPQNSFWEEVDFDTFWQRDTQTIVFKDKIGDWKIWQSDFLGIGNLDIVWLGDGNVLLHDKTNTKNIYVYNLIDDKLTYITDNIKAVSLNNNQVWFWFEDQIFRLNKDEIFNLGGVNWKNQKGYYLKDFPGIDDELIYNNSVTFKVKNVYQGVILYLDGQIYYQSDSQPNIWVLIASKVKYWTSTWHSIFWIDNQNTLVTHNLELKYERIVANLDADFTKDSFVNLDYYAQWHRLFLYKIVKKDNINQIQIDSIWYNPDFVNDEIRTFSVKRWLVSDVCRPFVEGGYIFCLDSDKSLVSYRNLN